MCDLLIIPFHDMFLLSLSQGYLLLSLLNGAQLPWSSSKSAEECLRMKRDTDIAQLAASLGCPPVDVWLSAVASVPCCALRGI